MIDIINGHLTPNGDLKYGNRPLFLTLYDSNSYSTSITELHKKDVYEEGKVMFGGHFFVSKTGQIVSGRPINAFGDFAKNKVTNMEFNINNVGICVEGEFDTELISDLQRNSISYLVQYLLNEYPSIIEIYALNELIPKERPGLMFPINQIRATATGSGSKPSVEAPNGKTTYSFGSRVLNYRPKGILIGNDVYELQYMLSSLGFDTERYGSYGLRTLNAVKNFQQKYSLPITGMMTEPDYEKIAKLTQWLRKPDSTFNRVLSYEEDSDYVMNGEDILVLQKRLNILGYKCVETGYYDEETFEVISKYQEYRALKRDGKVGPITWRYIMQGDIQFLTRTLKFSTPMQYGDDVRIVQQKLRELGYNIPDINNWYDLNTSNQVRQFQIDNNLQPVNGEVDNAVAKILFK